MKEYSISFLLDHSEYQPYYIGVFEDTEDPDIEWPHRHSFYSMVWFTEGCGSYVIDFQEYEIRPNHVFFVSPHQVHNWNYSDNAKGYFLMIEAEAFPNIDADIAMLYVDILNRQSLLNDIFTQLTEEYHHRDILSENIIQKGIAFLYSIISREIDLQKIKVPTLSPLVEKLRMLIESEKDIITVEGFANLLHVSKENLNNVCMQSVEISAKQFILNQKNIEAKRLMLYSLLNISEIAFRLGYQDTSYFARIFKNKNGCTPLKFIKKYRRKH